MTGWQPNTWSMVWGKSVGFTKARVCGSASGAWSVKVRVVVVVSGAVVVDDSPVVDVLDVDDEELLLVDDGSLLVVPAFDWAAPRKTVPAMSALVHSAPARNLFVIGMPPCCVGGRASWV